MTLPDKEDVHMSLELVPVNSLLPHIQPLQQPLADAARKVVESGYFVLGPSVVEFEREFAAYCGVEHCIGVANGTDALELSLKCLGVSANDRVAVVANAAMYSTSAVLACSARPVFVDIGEDNATMDPERLAEVLGRGGIKAVVVTHLYGQLARIEDIAQLCRRHGVGLVEDCAQAHGARNENGIAGSFGDVASFSFYPTKNLGAIGDGGAVVTRRGDLAARVRQLRQYGWTQKYVNGLPGGRNSRLDEIQASMLLVMLPHLNDWNARRRAVAEQYVRGIQNARIKIEVTPDQSYVAHLFVVRSEERSALQEHLAAWGIQSDIHYPTPDHKQPCHAGMFDDVQLPNTERDCATVLTLPCFPELTPSEIDRVIQACNQF